MNNTSKWLLKATCTRSLAWSAVSTWNTDVHIHISPIIAPSHWQYGDQNSLPQTYYFCLMKQQVRTKPLGILFARTSTLYWRNKPKCERRPADLKVCTEHHQVLQVLCHLPHSQRWCSSYGDVSTHLSCQRRLTMLDNFEHQATLVITAASLSSWGDHVQLTARALIPKK